jgi:hypothetical protein
LTPNLLRQHDQRGKSVEIADFSPETVEVRGHSRVGTIRIMAEVPLLL